MRLALACLFLAGAAGIARAQEDWRYRPRLTLGGGFVVLGDKLADSDTIFEQRNAIGLFAQLGVSLEAPERRLSAQLEASYQFLAPLNIICFDACPPNAVPARVASLRLGTRWRIFGSPGHPSGMLLSAGIGGYAPRGVERAHWQDPTAGFDFGMVFQRRVPGRWFLEFRGTKLAQPSRAWMLTQTIVFYP